MRKVLVLVAVAGCVLASGPAYAGDDDSGDSDEIHKMPGVDPDDPVVHQQDFEKMIANVNAAETNKAKEATAKTQSIGPFAGYAPPYKWATYKWIDSSYSAPSGGSKAYSWYVAPASSGQACSKGKGFNASQNVVWRSLGCGNSGSGTLPWDQALGIPGYKTTSQALPLGTPTYWK